jgi:hypothetical protein
MRTQLRLIIRLLAIVAICPALLSAAGLVGLRLDSDVLLKVNFEVEWAQNEVPPHLNGAFVMNSDKPSGALRKVRRYDTEIRESLRDRLAAVLKRHGFTGTIRLIEDATDADRGKPILALNLRRWGIDDHSRFDCHFTTRLVTPQGTADLGGIEYTDISLNSEYRKNRNIGLEKATDQALEQLNDKLTAAKLLLPAASKQR